LEDRRRAPDNSDLVPDGIIVKRKRRRPLVWVFNSLTKRFLAFERGLERRLGP